MASIDVVQSAGAETHVLPSVGAVLGFQLTGRVRAGEQLLAPLGVTGVQTAVRTYGYLPGTLTVLVRFTAQGASCLGVPGTELSERSVALEDLLPRPRGREVCERLLHAGNLTDAVATLHEFLLGLPYAHDRLVARALTLLDAAPPAEAQVSAVARELGVSERTLERRVLARVGLSPKRYASLRRFERARAALERGTPLVQAALAAGYYDQAHFIREFARFAGSSPGRFVRASRELSDSYNPLP